MGYRTLCSEESVDQVVDQYSQLIYRLAYAQTGSQQDAEDIYQEVFLRLVRKNPVFQSEEHRKAWLIRVTINCSKNLWSSAWRRHTVPLEEQPDGVEAASLEPLEEAAALRDCLLRLGKEDRAVLHLFYYQGFSVKQIAQVLGKRESAVKVRLMRARKKLETMLTGGEDDTRTL